MFGTMPSVIAGSPGGGLPVTAGLEFHLDFSTTDGVTFQSGSGDGDPVGTALDLSGNGNDWPVNTAQSSGVGPLWKENAQNGLGAIDWAGSDHYLERAALLSGSNSAELFMVLKKTTLAIYACGILHFSQGGDDPNWIAAGFTPNYKQRWGFGSTTSTGFIDLDPSPGSQVHQVHLWDMWSATNDKAVHLNDVEQYSSGTNTVDWNTGDWRFESNGNNYGTFEMYEVVFYDRKLDTDERADVTAYLNDKWNLPF